MWIKLLLLNSVYWYILFDINTINSYNIIYLFSIIKRLYSNKTYKTNKYSLQYKQGYKLTPKQKDAIIGIMLADGYLERGESTFNTRLRIDHTYPEQELYVLAIHTLFAPLIANEPVIIARKPDLRTGKVYKSVYVRTLRFSCLNKYHDLFYKDRIKVVPLNIKDLLTPIGLAHLLMGDGYLHNGVTLICSENFTKEQQELLLAALDLKFGIKATLNKRVSSSASESFRIRISKKSMNRLISIVRPYFIPEMLYKLGV